MSAYETVAKGARTAAKLRPVASSGKLRSKQRKWRVLLAIGLLLPALAAIIGIVAWAISMEVANGAAESQALSAGSFRKQQQQQQQQQQHTRPTSAYLHFKRQQTAVAQPEAANEPGHDEPVAAAVMAPASPARDGPATSRRRAQVGGLVKRKSESPDEAAAAVAPTPAGPTSSSHSNSNGSSLAARPGSTGQRRSSALLLTNLEQVEALSGLTSGPTAKTTSKPNNRLETRQSAGSSSTEAPTSDEAEETSASTISSQSSETGTGTDSRQKTKASSGGDGGSGEANEEPSDGMAPDCDQTQESRSSPPSSDPAEADTRTEPHPDTNSGDGDDDTADSQVDARKRIMSIMMMNSKNVGHKSRWLNEKTSAGRASKRPINFSLLPASERKRILSKQLLALEEAKDSSDARSSRQNNKGTIISGNKKATNVRLIKPDAKITLPEELRQANNRYIIEDKAPEERQVRREEEHEASVIANGGDEAEPSNKSPSSDSESSSSEARDEVPATVAQVRNAAAANSAAQQEQLAVNSNGSKTNEQQQDDELSFEVIASAISKTLSANSGGESGQPGSMMSGDVASAAFDSAAGPPGGATSSEGSSLLARPPDGDSGVLLETADREQQAALDEVSNGGGTGGESAGYPQSGATSSGTGQVPTVAAAAGTAALASHRRRTTGEHVAEVIDHIVERRKQAIGGLHLAADQRGPQIVVVAPVSGSMKARSLTKAAPQASESGQVGESKSNSSSISKASIKNKPSVVEDRRIVSSMKKDAILLSGGKKASVSSVANNNSKARQLGKLLGARLLGTGLEASDKPDQVSDNKAAPIKYSERVEVIEDDDSSAFLMKPLPSLKPLTSVNNPDSGSAELVATQAIQEGGQTGELHVAEDTRSPSVAAIRPESEQGQQQMDELDRPLDEQSSIHVSSQPGEPRHRSPRHEIHPSLTFERFARAHQVAAERRREQPTAASGLAQENVNGPQMKLYSAEQLIREHVLKSKSRSKQPAQQQAPSEEQKISHPRVALNSSAAQQQQEQQQQQSPPQQQPQQLQQQPQPQRVPTHQVKVSPTTLRPYLPQADERGSRQNPSEETGRLAPAANLPGIQVPLFFQTNFHGRPSKSLTSPAQQAQVMMRPSETYQAMESQASASFQRPQLAQEQPPAHTNLDPHLHQQQQESSQAQSHQSPQISLHHQQQQHQQHHHHHQQQQQHQQHHHHHQQQQQPMQGAESMPQEDPQADYLRGSQGQPLPQFADQEFNVPAHMAESVIQDIQRTPSTVSMVNGQPTLMQVPYQSLALGQQQNLMASGSGPQSLYLASQQQAWKQAAAAGLLARMAANKNDNYNNFNNNNFHNNEQRDHYQQQRHVLADRTGLEPAPVSISVKPPKGMIHPVAQMALRHLFSSLGQQEQQLNADVAPRSSSVPASQAPSQQVAETQQVAASAPQPSAALAPVDMASAASAGRQMRSLPIGGQPQNSQQQVEINDQEVQESYGPQPTYHMGGYEAPQYGGGGGGYGGGGYGQSEHDKKSKGITFHFGGGPIGGGTQLITSPMGIFKHLMIPLLPNPRVNLNGKVVFGVVLEKSTAIGPPPIKKKYKFWGR